MVTDGDKTRATAGQAPLPQAEENCGGDRALNARLLRIVGDLRQLLYPAPFRISRAPEVSGEREPAVGKTPVAKEAPDTEPQAAPEGQRGTRELLALLADMATALWRMRRRMQSAEQSGGNEEVQRLGRYLESAWDRLAGSKIEVREHTGERYVTGMALRVIAFQPAPGISEETVSETIKPTVFYRDNLIQRGEVVVLTPAPEEGVGKQETGDAKPEGGGEGGGREAQDS